VPTFPLAPGGYVFVHRGTLRHGNEVRRFKVDKPATEAPQALIFETFKQPKPRFPIACVKLPA